MGTLLGCVLAVVAAGEGRRWVASSAAEQAYVEHAIVENGAEGLESARRAAWSPVRRLREPRYYLTGEEPGLRARAGGPSSVVSTLAWDALLGGVAGGLVGGAIFLLDDIDQESRHIGPWVGGGALLGALVGVAQVVVQETRGDDLQALRERPEAVKAVRVRLAGVAF